MQLKTFRAYFALLDQKWGWPDEATEEQAEYKAQLWAEVCEWNRDKTICFKQACNELIAQRFGRPTVKEIVCFAKAKLGIDEVDEERAQTRSRKAMWDYYAERGEEWAQARVGAIPLLDGMDVRPTRADVTAVMDGMRAMSAAVDARAAAMAPVVPPQLASASEKLRAELAAGARPSFEESTKDIDDADFDQIPF